jgi:CRISPR-associated endonuclease/helicase Cas3
VNRRLLIDQAFDHGRKLAKMLAAGKDAQGRDSDPVRLVGTALRSLTPLGLAEGPLQVTRLRGGAELGERPIDPSQPAVVFATVAMFASRWLFRGYGTSRSMRPVDAALAGIDSLVLLDEAHLSRPLVDLARKILQCDIGDPARVIPSVRSRPVLVSLTATGEGVEHRFDLDTSDLANEIVCKRMNAPKPMRLLEASQRSLAGDLAKQALRLLDRRAEPGACVVFVNTPKLARDVVDELAQLTRKRTRASDIVMATGRMREREADVVRRLLLDPEIGAPAGRDRSASRERDLIAVATQTLEVGADLDFDVLVTETCGTRALIQRVGRLNRLGEAQDAAGAVIHVSDRKEWPVYGTEPTEVWEQLGAAQTDGSVDLPPSRVSTILQPPSDEPPRVGELLHAHLWEWAKTSLPPKGEAPVGLFFEGFDEQIGRLSVCWRAHLPHDGVRLFPGVKQDECIEIPIWELRDALSATAVDEVRRLSEDRASLETVSLERLRPGDQVVLPTHVGLYDRNGWNPDARGEVLDVSLFRLGRLPLSPAALQHLAPGVDVSKPLARLIDPGEEALALEEESELLDEVLERLRSGPHHPWLTDAEWLGFLDDLTAQVERPIDDDPFLQPKPVRRSRPEIRSEAFEETNFEVASLTLDDHHGAVAAITRKSATALGVRSELVETLEAAARLHDIGKADPRFQRWLDPEPIPSMPKAKSATPRHLIERERIASGWPRGGRHELLSQRIVSDWIASLDGDVPWDPELLMHLVAAHHGHGRPLVPPAEDPFFPAFMATVDGTDVRVSAGLSQVDWEQPRRFRQLCERYGYWGLALMEAIVRQSDHAASRAGALA